MLNCDRLEYRYIVDTDDAVHWRDFAPSVAIHGRMILESVHGARPDTWWVLKTSVLGVLDRTYSISGGNPGAQEHATPTSASAAHKGS